MKCPTDDTTLQMSERSGIEIDYCPQCRGVWLDRGELDKLIERSSEREEALLKERPARYEDDDRYRERHHDYRHDSYKHKKYRKKSLLGEILDF